jgi:hypothetical protein
MLKIIILSVIMLSVVMLNVIILSVIMLSVIVLIVVAPYCSPVMPVKVRHEQPLTKSTFER